MKKSILCVFIVVFIASLSLITFSLKTRSGHSGNQHSGRRGHGGRERSHRGGSRRHGYGRHGYGRRRYGGYGVYGGYGGSGFAAGLLAGTLITIPWHGGYVNNTYYSSSTIMCQDQQGNLIPCQRTPNGDLMPL